MYKIKLDILCLDGYSEALPDNEGSIEQLIKSLVTLILLDLFSRVIVDRMRVLCLPATPQRNAICMLQVQVVCPTGTDEITADKLTTLEAKLEDVTCCALIELFSEVIVDQVVVEFEYNTTWDVDLAA